MQNSRQIIRFVWLAPLVLHCTDALAWGLFTHVYFAQWLIWSMPLLDPNLRRAVRRFPQLVLAGACLPDLALMSPVFRNTHRWESCQDLLRCAASDEERAIAVGYASHLFVDVVAHNHFVPAHEEMWLDDTLFTHVFSEWALDAHLAPLLDTTPYRLLQEHRHVLAHLMARNFKCSERSASVALRRLAAADRLLRLACLPQLLYRTLRYLDRRAYHHFIYYVSQTQAAIDQIGSLLAGVNPLWEPEPANPSPSLLAQLRKSCVDQLHARHHTPIDFFQPAQKACNIPALVPYNIKDMLAISAPIAAPANTSVG